jgi:N-acetyl sugar amidotransferase
VQKTLVLTVHGHPFGNGEPFLHGELWALQPYFERIILVPERDPPPNEEPLFALPPHTFVLPVGVPRSWRALAEVMSRQPRRLPALLANAARDAAAAGIPGAFKSSFGFAARAAAFERRLRTHIDRMALPRHSLYLYSYWLTEQSAAIGSIRHDDPQVRAFARGHGWDIYAERHTPPHLPFRRAIIERLDKTFTVSQHGRLYLMEKMGAPAAKVQVARLGTEPAPYRSCEPQPDTLRILSLAFITPVKNLELLVDALVALDGNPRIEWHHIGDGTEHNDAYAASVRELALQRLGRSDRVHLQFHGTQTSAGVDEFLSTMPIDLLINTSRSEGVPVSIMEAMSHGIPVVAPNVGGIPEIVHDGANGLLLSEAPGPAEVAGALRRFHALSAAEKERMRRSAHATWERDLDGRRNYAWLARTLLGERAAEEPRVCTRCVLDTRDYPGLDFDDAGLCNVCRTYDEIHRRTVYHGDEGQRRLQAMIDEVKSWGRGRAYDCLIGVSGGVDSTYLAYLAKQSGLRPLVLHVDNGWDAELAVGNIEQIVRRLGLDLYTHVVDWDEMRDLQLAFLKASVVDIDVPTDNTYIASIYKIARKFGIRHVITGHNTATEGWLPPNFNHYKYDMLNIRAIHRRFGQRRLKTLPLIGPFGLWANARVRGIKTHSPLDFVDYNKAKAKALIASELGWRDYGSKHFENVFTRFYQGYILPEKFGVDKRRAHLSTLICSRQITRAEAEAELQKPRYDHALYRTDREFFLKKLGLTEGEFGAIMRQPPVPHTAYSSYLNWFKRARPLARAWRRLRRG